MVYMSLFQSPCQSVFLSHVARVIQNALNMFCLHSSFQHKCCNNVWFLLLAQARHILSSVREFTATQDSSTTCE